MAYSTILVACHIRTVALEITSFPTIIVYKVKAIGFKMTGFTIAITKLKNFLKKIISTYIAGKQTKIAF